MKYNLSVFITSIVSIFLFGTAVSSTTKDYGSANINLPDGDICQPDDVVGELKQQYLIPPVDLNVRGLSDRIPLRLDDIGSHGETRSDSNGNPVFHAGTDLLADIGEPVLAVARGLVVAEGFSDKLGRE